MKTRFAILLSVILLSLNAYSQKGEIKDWWNDLSVCQVNKVAPRTNVIPYSNEKDIADLAYMNSEYYKCLNDDWWFYLSKNPEGVAEGFYNIDYDYRNWKSIKVPGNWELQGFDNPVYVNVANEFKSNPPYAPTEYNPVGHYIYEFGVPESWQGRNVYINFGAVKSAMYLWINGQFVGYSEDSKTPAEFDITPYLNKKGGNKLAVRIYRFSNGSYLEAQDFWRNSANTTQDKNNTKPKQNLNQK